MICTVPLHHKTPANRKASFQRMSISVVGGENMFWNSDLFLWRVFSKSLKDHELGRNPRLFVFTNRLYRSNSFYFSFLPLRSNRRPIIVRVRLTIFPWRFRRSQATSEESRRLRRIYIVGRCFKRKLRGGSFNIGIFIAQWDKNMALVLSISARATDGDDFNPPLAVFAPADSSNCMKRYAVSVNNYICVLRIGRRITYCTVNGY